MRTIELKPFGSDGAIRVAVERNREQPEKELFTIHWQDRQAEADCHRLSPQRGLLHVDGQVVPFAVQRDAENIEVWVKGKIYAFEIVKRTAQRSQAPAAGAVSDRLTAPMPGSIVKIDVAAGESFAANQTLVVMESMKMEMTLSVPHEGIVKEVVCQVGQRVERGAVLAELES